MSARVVVVPYNPEWPETYAALAAELSERLGNTAREVLHVGSTAVPGLAAKPVIDIVLVVDDSADETAYRSVLERDHYRLVVSEPEWFEHRMFKRGDPAVNLHVFSVGCEEVGRVVRFRDWLREHEDDRDLYAATKKRLAHRTWSSVQEYADAKGDVVAEILARADAGR